MGYFGYFACLCSEHTTLMSMNVDYIILSMMGSFINDSPVFLLSKMELIR